MVPSFLRLLPLLAAVSCWGADHTVKPSTQWLTSASTGMADTFQLTLGGVFGEGPAWHGRLETGLSHVWTTDDAIFVFGSQSFDAPSRLVNWQVGIGYRRPLVRTRNQVLTATLGAQHWQLQGVLCGTRDWLSYHALNWQRVAGRRLPAFAVTSDSWSVYRSPLPLGTLVHTQAWAEHSIVRKERVRVSFRHGPAHTYSWGFFGTNGHRVVRYQTMMSVGWQGMRFEGGWRRQWGLQRGIPNNGFWQFCLTRSFRRGL